MSQQIEGLVVIEQEPHKEPTIRFNFNLQTRWMCLRQVVSGANRAGLALQTLGHLPDFEAVQLPQRNRDEASFDRLVHRYKIASLGISRCLFGLGVGDWLWAGNEERGDEPTSHGLLNEFVGSISLSTWMPDFTDNDVTWWERKIRDRLKFPAQDWSGHVQFCDARLAQLLEEAVP